MMIAPRNYVCLGFTYRSSGLCYRTVAVSEGSPKWVVLQTLFSRYRRIMKP
jgi:hypothetical protein